MWSHDIGIMGLNNVVTSYWDEWDSTMWSHDIGMNGTQQCGHIMLG